VVAGSRIVRLARGARPRGPQPASRRRHRGGRGVPRVPAAVPRSRPRRHRVADAGHRRHVFRIGSITKTFTAIAVLQLWEQGLVDLDAPANTYLRAFRIVSNEPGWRQATVRHLLTHTAGLPELARPLHAIRSGLLQRDVPAGSARAQPRRVLPGPAAADRRAGHDVHLHQPHVRGARADRGRRRRTAAGPLPPRAHLRAPRDDGQRSRPARAAAGAAGDGLQAPLHLPPRP
jgi:hypothetical protein